MCAKQSSPVELEKDPAPHTMHAEAPAAMAPQSHSVARQRDGEHSRSGLVNTAHDWKQVASSFKTDIRCLEPFRLRNHYQQPALISSAVQQIILPIGCEPKGNIEGLAFAYAKFDKAATLLFHNCKNAGYCKKVGRTRVVSRAR